MDLNHQPSQKACEPSELIEVEISRSHSLKNLIEVIQGLQNVG